MAFTSSLTRSVTSALMFTEILRKILKVSLRNIVDTWSNTKVCQIFSATSLFAKNKFTTFDFAFLELMAALRLIVWSSSIFGQVSSKLCRNFHPQFF